MKLQLFLQRQKRPNKNVSDIQLRVPAQPEFVGLVRSTTNSVIARTELGVDELEDWALCVGEAFNLVINHKPASGSVEVSFTLQSGGVQVQITGPAGASLETLNNSDIATQLAWTLLREVSDEVATAVSVDGSLTLTLKSRVVASA